MGDTRLQALTPDQLNAFYGELLLKGRKDGKTGLSPKTVHNVHVMLHKALHDAVRRSYLPRNVAEYSDPPKQTSSGRAMRTWAPEGSGASSSTSRTIRCTRRGSSPPAPE